MAKLRNGWPGSSPTSASERSRSAITSIPRTGSNRTAWHGCSANIGANPNDDGSADGASGVAWLLWQTFTEDSAVQRGPVFHDVSAEVHRRTRAVSVGAEGAAVPGFRCDSHAA